MHALILAGGFATRLWPLTEKTAKPLIPLAGKALASYLVEKIPEDIPITISTNQVFAEDFEVWKKKFPKRKIEILIEDSVGESEKKGALAATALFIEEKKLKTDLFLLAGDNYFGFNFEDFFEESEKNKKNPILAAYDIRDIKQAKSFGVVVPSKNKKNTVEHFEEKPEKPSSTLVSTGAYIFPQKFLHHIITYSKDHADDLGGIFEYCMSQGEEVNYFSFDQQWYDVGSFPAFLQANQDLMQGKNFLDVSLQKDTKTKLIQNCYAEKNIFLKNVTAENVVLLEGSTLKNCDLKNCVIGKNCLLENTDFSGKIVRDNTVVIG